MEHIMIVLAAGYLLIMSLTGYLLMGIDKKRAIRRQWRIPERTLLLIAFLGGGMGSFLGMFTFRHKTKHVKFTILLPIAAILYAYLCYRLLIYK